MGNESLGERYKTKVAITVFINSSSEGENETRLSPRGPAGPKSARVGSGALIQTPVERNDALNESRCLCFSFSEIESEEYAQSPRRGAVIALAC